MPGYYVLATGGVLQPGEEDLENAIREVEEEMGIKGVELRFHQKFKHVEINNFNSTYFLLSRTLNALVAKNTKEIDYNSEINHYASKLPAFGAYAPLKLFKIRK